MKPLIVGILFANLGMTLVEIYTLLRQFRTVHGTKEEPAELRLNGTDNDTFAEIKSKELNRVVVNIIGQISNAIGTTVKLYMEFPSWLWGIVTANVVDNYEQTMTYVMSEKLINEMLILPLELLVLEEKMALFLITLILKMLITCGLFWIVDYYMILYRETFGRNYFLMAIVLTFIERSLFVILLNLGKRHDGYFNVEMRNSLRQKLQKLSKQTEFPFSNIYINDNKEESEAYYMGWFFSHAIVISSHLVSLLSDEEIVAVVAHEMGHWKNNHYCYKLLYEVFYFIGMWYCLSEYYDSPALYDAFNLNVHNSAMSTVLINQYMLPPLDLLFTTAVNLSSRSCEFEADNYAKECGHAAFLRSALIKLYKDKKQFPVNDWLYYICHSSHPSILERILAVI